MTNVITIITNRLLILYPSYTYMYTNITNIHYPTILLIYCTIIHIYYTVHIRIHVYKRYL